MNIRRAYEIAFVGLKPGIHEFSYVIDDKFFEHYGEQDFRNCHSNIKLELDKNNGFLMLKFDIGGVLDTSCDRCGNTLQLQLWDEFRIVVKMVEEPDLMNAIEEDPDIYYISPTESHLNVGDWIYEFINLSIPMHKICSDEEFGGPKCNKEVLEKLRRMENEAVKQTNPVWKGLEQFKIPPAAGEK